MKRRGLLLKLCANTPRNCLVSRGFEKACLGEEEGGGRTLFDAFPYTVLFCFSQTGDAFCVTPTNKVGLLELTHKSLLACFWLGGQHELLGGRGDKVEDKSEGEGLRESSLGCGGAHGGRYGVVVVYQSDGPMPVWRC